GAGRPCLAVGHRGRPRQLVEGVREFESRMSRYPGTHARQSDPCNGELIRGNAKPDTTGQFTPIQFPDALKPVVLATSELPDGANTAASLTPSVPFEIDHIIARKHGGSDVSSNLAMT